MKSTYLASTALALVLSTGVAFAGPTATTNQGGLNNDVYIEQAGTVQSDTSASVTQDADTKDNYAQVKQLGKGTSLATITRSPAISLITPETAIPSSMVLVLGRT